MTTELTKEELASTDNLLKFLEQNTGVDFVSFNLLDEEKLASLNFKNLKRKLAEVTFQLKAYQRLLRIIPEHDHAIAISLMQQGLHSALQIAAMTRRDFLSRCKGVLDEKQADAIYQNALTKRSSILVQYMNTMQNKEPHITSARFN